MLTDSVSSVQVGEFEWSDKEVAMILAAFSFGTTITNFLGGRAAEKFGGRLIFGMAVLTLSILSLLSPLSAYVSEYLLFALRVIEGMAQVKCYKITLVQKPIVQL